MLTKITTSFLPSAPPIRKPSHGFATPPVNCFIGSLAKSHVWISGQTYLISVCFHNQLSTFCVNSLNTIASCVEWCNGLDLKKCMFHTLRLQDVLENQSTHFANKLN